MQRDEPGLCKRRVDMLGHASGVGWAWLFDMGTVYMRWLTLTKA